MAGTSRLQYPTNVRLIRTMCSGRVDEEFVIHAFQKGVALVLVSGCHFADCPTHRFLPEFNPRTIILRALYRFEEELTGPDSLMLQHLQITV